MYARYHFWQSVPCFHRVCLLICAIFHSHLLIKALLTSAAGKALAVQLKVIG